MIIPKNVQDKFNLNNDNESPSDNTDETKIKINAEKIGNISKKMRDEILHQIELKNMKKEEQIHHLELENERYQNTYESCCLKIDKRALEFFLKSFVIFSVLIFAMLMSVYTENVSERNAFINIVILILGCFLPSPSIKKDSKK